MPRPGSPLCYRTAAMRSQHRSSTPQPEQRRAPTGSVRLVVVNAATPLEQIIAPDWARALAPVEPQIRAMGDFLRAETAAGRGYLPAGAVVLRAATRTLSNVRVLIAVHTPYPTSRIASILSFSLQPHVRPLPRA